MAQCQVTIGQKIAWAARTFEKRRTKHGRKWVAVFLNEATIVIALHGSLTAAETEPTTGSVVQVFTTDTVGEEFLLAPGEPAGTRAPGHGPPRRHEGNAAEKPTKPDV